jgi:hypothetical protein
MRIGDNRLRQFALVKSVLKFEEAAALLAGQYHSREPACSTVCNDLDITNQGAVWVMDANFCNSAAALMIAHRYQCDVSRFVPPVLPFPLFSHVFDKMDKIS